MFLEFELHSELVRWAAAEGVSETVIAAVLLLHEGSVDEITSKIRPDELERVIKLVGRCPSSYPPGALDALKARCPERPSATSNEASGRRPAWAHSSH